MTTEQPKPYKVKVGWNNGSGGDLAGPYYETLGEFATSEEACNAAPQLYKDWRTTHPASNGWRSRAWPEVVYDSAPVEAR